jgi:hypothetical protein
MRFKGRGIVRVPQQLIGFAIVLFSLHVMALNVLMQHNDLSRTGANTRETLLTTANVASSFGPLFTDAVDGQVYAQPLYVQNLNIAGGTHDVIFVCTESNSVYALDADTPNTTYWYTNFGEPFSSDCGDLLRFVGITSTPVIDLASGTIYVESCMQTGDHELHALDITTGAEKFGGPVTLAAPGFVPGIERQRAGLLLLSNVVYLCFASYCDENDYHGFILGYNATNLTLQYTFNVTPSGIQGGIWNSGMAPAVDTNGNIYVMTGNGTFDGTNNFAMSMLKLSANLTLEDYATPTNYQGLSDADLDLGSGGVVLLPTHYAVGIGKDLNLFLADINNMGQVGNFVQAFAAEQYIGDVVGQSPVYWQGPSMQYLFLSHGANQMESFQFTGTNFNVNPLGTSPFYQNDVSGGLSLSANGTNNGIVWEIGSDSNLRAYDAVNFPNELWMGSVGTFVKMTSPTIANGRVYIGTYSNVSVWGLTNFLYMQTGIRQPVLTWSAGTLTQSTNLLGPWMPNPASPPYTILPTNSQTFYRLSFQ